MVSQANFPANENLSAADVKRYEVEVAVDAGAHEIELVPSIASIAEGRYGEVLREIRADAGLQDVPVLLLTRLEPPAELEPDGVVLKPFTPSTLRASLTPWLS